MAVYVANGGGGTVVFGIWDNIIGRVNAILGVPPQIYPIVWLHSTKISQGIWTVTKYIRDWDFIVAKNINKSISLPIFSVIVNYGSQYQIVDDIKRKNAYRGTSSQTRSWRKIRRLDWAGYFYTFRWVSPYRSISPHYLQYFYWYLVPWPKWRPCNHWTETG